MDSKQVLEFIIRPTLASLGLGGKGAERLLLGTALTESGLQYISQIPSGIAKGIYQMEKATHDDIWKNYLQYHPTSSLVHDLTSSGAKDTSSYFAELPGNLYYATAMTRIHYLRVKEPMPSGDNLEELAHYWKDHYNTKLGAGRVEDFINKAKIVMSL